MMRYKKIAEIADVVTGGTPSTSKTEYWDGGTIPWLQSGCCQNCDVVSTEKYITRSGYDNSSTKMMVPDTVMIALTGATAGKVGYLKFAACGNQSITGILPSERINSRFLFYYLISKREHILADCIGGAQPHISQGYVKNILIPDITLEEQEKVVTELEKVSLIIREREKQIKLFDELVKARFVEFFGDMADPRCKWDRCKLVHTCADPNDIKCGPFGTQLSKEEYTDSGVEVWEIPQINSEFKTVPTHFVTKEKAQKLEQYSIKPGDIAMSRKGNVGRCAVFPETFEEGIIHSDVLRIRVDDSRVAPEFLMRQLHYSNDIQHQIELVSSGAIMAGINVTKLKDISVYVPPKALQDEFVSFVKQVDKSKVEVQKTLEKTQLLFDSLMQEYFGT